MATKRTKKTAPARVAKRAAPRKKGDLFAELVEGFDALWEAREGKRTLRTHVVSSSVHSPTSVGEIDQAPRRPRPVAPGLRRLPAHQSPHPRKLGAGACEPECTGRATDSPGQALSRHGAAPRNALAQTGGRIPPMQATPTPLANRLLIALPALADPHFARSVALVCQHDDEGAMGVVVNRAVRVHAGRSVPADGHRQRRRGAARADRAVRRPGASRTRLRAARRRAMAGIRPCTIGERCTSPPRATSSKRWPAAKARRTRSSRWAAPAGARANSNRNWSRTAG